MRGLHDEHELVLVEDVQAAQQPGPLLEQPLVGAGRRQAYVEQREGGVGLGLGYVASSTPSPGDTAPKGSTVILRIV